MCVYVSQSSTSSYVFFQYDSFLKYSSYSNIVSQKEYKVMWVLNKVMYICHSALFLGFYLPQLSPLLDTLP